MSDDRLDRDQRVAIMADSLHVASERGRRDYAIGFASVSADWLDRMPDADVQLRCAANLLRIAVEPPD